MALKPWYNVAIPREDLREGRPLDASEFAVHLDQVRDGRAPAVYQTPERFFERTFLMAGTGRSRTAAPPGTSDAITSPSPLIRTSSASTSTSTRSTSRWTMRPWW